MKESLPLSYVETVENTTIENLLTIYENALTKSEFKDFEVEEKAGKQNHKAIWGELKDRERKSLLTFEAMKEKSQRFCAKASLEQIGEDVRFTIEVIPWMETEDKPEEPGVTQSATERTYDEIYARLRLEEILSAMPGVGEEPDDILYAPHYDDLPKQEKLRKLEQRFRDGKMSKEMYEKIKEWIEAGN
ncbi:MAG: hypothetical protein JSV09_03920 [Thermoplasmata archaeon]|nr:MAG: hypothetical protein JSV09_03920 [Thermoplasmata archaeon]